MAFPVDSSKEDNRVLTSEISLPCSLDSLMGKQRSGLSSRKGRYVKEAPEEFKAFLEEKEQFNKSLVDLFFGSPDVSLSHRSNLWDVQFQMKGIILTRLPARDQGKVLSSRSRALEERRSGRSRCDHTGRQQDSRTICRW